jgi:hypothetical protein
MKKGLIAVLIAANLLMLVLGILTIPPNLRSATGKKPPVIKTEQTTPYYTVAGGRNTARHIAARGRNPIHYTATGGRNPACGHGKRRHPRSGGNRREFIHGGTPRFGGLSLVHRGRAL